MYWAFRLPGNAAELKVSPADLEVMAGGLALLTGAAYSLLWAALYVPTAMVLSGEASRAARLANKVTPDEEAKWLKENDLYVSGWQQVLRLAAMLAPLISGWIGEPAGKLVAALGGGG